MPFADLGDVTINYRKVGEGPFAYVFCHGLGGGGMGFAEEFDFWRQHFPRVLTWDNRGVGQSSGAAKYSMPLFAGDLARLMDHVGIQRAVVHGVSWGGVVAQQFTLDHTERCAALVLDSTSSEVNQAASEAWYRMGEDARLDRQGARTVPPEQLDSFVARCRAIAALREHPYTPRLKTVACPALVVGAGQDTVAGTGGSVILARSLPKARLEIVQDAAHGVYRSRPEVFRRLVVEFCKEQGVI